MQTQIDDYTVKLTDDGTLDTVLTVHHKDGKHEVQFDTESASWYRDPFTGEMTGAGFKELAEQAVEDFELSAY